MKKLSKILCAVLVLAVLSTSLALIVSANDFEPTATIIPLAQHADRSSYTVDGTGNHITNSGLNQIGDDIKPYVVTTADGNTYLQLVSQADEDGKFDGHVQWTTAADDGSAIVYDENSNTYVVYEMDIATESDLINFMFIHRTATGPNGTGSDKGGDNVDAIGTNIKFAAGEFHRYAIVCDFNNNKAYHFLDNELVVTKKLTTDGTHASWMSGELAELYSAIKIQAHESYPNTPLVEGESLLVDNFKATVYHGEGAGNLADSIAASSLSSWTNNVFNSDYVLPTIPDLVEIDGVRYNNVADANAYLDSHTPTSVVLLRDFVSILKFTGKTTVTANGVSTYNFGAGAEVVDNGNGTLTVMPPYHSQLEYSEVVLDKIGSSYAHVDAGGNSSMGQGNFGNVAFSYADLNKYESSDKYFGIYVAEDTASNKANPFLSVNAPDSHLLATPGETTAYYVIEFDVASHSEYLTYLDVSVVLRNKSTGGGFPFSDNIYLSDYLTGSDEWNHVTLVGDFANNTVNVYINGEYVGHGENPHNGDNGKAYRPNQLVTGETHVTFKGIRIDLGLSSLVHEFTKGQNIMFDNFSQKVYADATAAGTLVTANNAKDITTWSEYDSKRGGEKLAPLASVNGTVYYNYNELNKALSTNNTLEVDILSKFFVPYEINADATINTNGIEGAIVAGEGVVLTPDANSSKILHSEAPYQSNVTLENITTSHAWELVKGKNSDNKITTPMWSNYNADTYRGVYLATNNETGEKYFLDQVYSTTPVSNANHYIDWQATINYASGVNQHVVFDMDIALLRNYAINLNPITRNSGNGGQWGNSAGDINTILATAGIPNGEFAHITAVLSVDTRDMHVFVNGEYVQTIANAIIAGANGDGYKLTAIRTFSSSQATASYANVSLREVRSADLAAAVAAKNITAWSGDLYDANATHPAFAPIASVDGVNYYDINSLNEALYGNVDTPKVVEFFHGTTGPVKYGSAVKLYCDAVVTTHGLNVEFEFAPGVKVDAADGESFTFDADFISETDYVQVKDHNVIKFSHSDNKITSIGVNQYNGVNQENPEGHINVYTPNYNGNSMGYLQFAPAMGTTVESCDNSFINFNTDSLEFTNGDDRYFVVDFDMAVTGEDMTLYSYYLIRDKATAGTSWFNSGNGDIASRPLTIVRENAVEGEFVHITLVAEVKTNTIYAFANNVLVGTANLVKPDKFAENPTETLLAQGMRISIENKSYDDTNAWMLDNALIRYYTAAEAGNVASAIESGNLADWSKAVAYSLPTTPVIGTVDGVACNSIGALKAAMAADGEHNVVLTSRFYGELSLTDKATVATNKLFDNIVAAKTDSFDIVNDADETITISNKYILNKIDAEHYTAIEITAANYAEYTTLVTWFTTPDSLDDMIVVAYPFGEQIVAPETIAYIENGKLAYAVWHDLMTDELVESFPVSSADITTALNFYCTMTVSDEDCAFAAGVLHNLDLNTDLTLKVYVPTYVSGLEGYETTVIDGVEYYVITKAYDVLTVAEKLELSFSIVHDGKTYVQYVSVSPVDYATDLLADESVDEAEKKIVYAAFNYVAEAYKLLKGEACADVAALLEANAAFAPEAAVLGEAQDTTAVSDVIRAAAMKLDTLPKFVFKVARGFVGDITFTVGDVTVTKTVDASASEVLVVLDNFTLATIADDITITIGEASATYNLNSYAVGLGENGAFATALITYANLVKAAAEAEPDEPTPDEPTPDEPVEEGDPVIVDGYLNIELIEDPAEVESETLVLINAGKLKQYDQCEPDENGWNETYGYFTKEGGEPFFVKIPKDNAWVEGVYFIRESDWEGYDALAENQQYVEHRYSFGSAKTITSVSFDYIVNGTSESVNGYAEGIFQIKTSAGAYVNVSEGADTYDECGEWRTFTATFEEPVEVTDLLVKMCHFNGEMVIANLVITYAE